MSSSDETPKIKKDLTPEQRKSINREKRNFRKFKALMLGPFGEWLDKQIKTGPVGWKLDLGPVIFLKTAVDKIQVDYKSIDGPKVETWTIEPKPALENPVQQTGATG